MHFGIGMIVLQAPHNTFIQKKFGVLLKTGKFSVLQLRSVCNDTL